MIRENARRLLQELPEGVELVGAAKTKSPREILEAIEAGVRIIGENYVQEAEKAYQAVGNRAKWHMIGHLQRNKVKKAVRIFDMIQTLDSLRLAAEIHKECHRLEKIMPVLIEINSGEEDQKTGVTPENAISLIKEITSLTHIKVTGLMTMGPLAGSPEESRPYFRKAKEIFDRIRAMNIPGVEMICLSMGMSHSYKVAIEEGSNMVRIGTRLFGIRNSIKGLSTGMEGEGLNP